MAKKLITQKKVLCKTTCQAGDMGLGYCIAGKIYEVNSNVKISHHFEELKSPKEEMAELKEKKIEKESMAEDKDVIEEPAKDKK